MRDIEVHTCNINNKVQIDRWREIGFPCTHLVSISKFVIMNSQGLYFGPIKLWKITREFVII